ncbi:hypothetical protein FACS189419_00020 [Planctomycetales bacterium]|nr:hypothetical protein FACS189419_00020 [Planctomycetales bacterium]
MFKSPPPEDGDASYIPVVNESSEVLEDCDTDFPQEPQNFSPAVIGTPQCGQGVAGADGGLIEGFSVEESVFDSGCGVRNGLSGDTVSECCFD